MEICKCRASGLARKEAEVGGIIVGNGLGRG
jgi:hypothetical protein